MTSRRWLAAAVLLGLLAAACTSTPTNTATNNSRPEPEPTATVTSEVAAATSVPEAAQAPQPSEPELALPDLELALVWHQHQPSYPVIDGLVSRPWVRLHAAKDYVDMATLVAEFPDLAATFNLTPVLLDQLDQLAAGARDRHWAVSEIPIVELADADRTFIVDRFFDINPQVIDTMPRYRELRAIRDQGQPFTDAELQDLRALFHIGWIDPEVPGRSAYLDKGHDFTDSDVRGILAITQQQVELTISTHADLWADGQIEVITTPLAHPILPLIADTDLARVGDPTALMPRTPFREFDDASEQVRLGLDLADELLGRRPVGMWPAEGAVADPIMRLFARHGVQWVASGEQVLSESLGIGGWDRDENDTVGAPELLYRPWGVETNEGTVTMFFRDNRLSDLIGFEYSGRDPEEAADDFIQRLDAIRQSMAGRDLDFQPIVTVLLDGENAWENYPNDGIDFLRALYRRLTTTDWLTTTTPTRYLAAHPESPATLDEVYPASWLAPNYHVWIGEAEEARAWDLLRFTRQALGEAERRGTAADVQLDAAKSAMFAAEGSDWFWFYGDDMDSGDDGYFDAAFRELLGQVYDALEVDRPRWVDVPIVATPGREPYESTIEPVEIAIDGSSDGWEHSNRFVFEEAVTGAKLRALDIAVSESSVAIRLGGALTDGAEIYLRSPRGSSQRGTTIDDRLLTFDATHLVQITPEGSACVSSTLLPVTEVGRYPALCTPIDVANLDDGIELAVPLDMLGGLTAGDRLLARVVIGDELFPADRGAQITVPAIGAVEAVRSLQDPADDDTGIGTYTYPTDSVFVPGSYDLTGFEVGEVGDDVVFTLTVDAPVLNPWNSAVGLSIQSFDIYLDLDPGAGTGHQDLLDGRNAALSAEHGWEAAIAVEGWDRAVAVADDDGGYREEKPTIAVLVLAEAGQVTVRVPRYALPKALDLDTVGIAVAVLSQEGFPSPGVRRVRDIASTASQWRGGGAPTDAQHTRIYDVLAPDGVDQAAMLAANTIPINLP